MSINFQNAIYIRSASGRKDLLNDGKPQFVFTGRSNVGKSSVINCLLNRKNLAYSGSSPGKTAGINYFEIDRKIYFVDVPGYGYAKVSQKEKARWAKMMEEYFSNISLISMGILIVDVRQTDSPLDRNMAETFRNGNMPFAVVANKTDKVGKEKLQRSLQNIREYLLLDGKTPLIPFSAKTGTGRKELLTCITYVSEYGGMGVV